MKEKSNNVMDKLEFGMLLALVGGFMDVYSYIVRGKVFATGQTGNFILVAVRLAEKDYKEMLHALVPIISFWIGIFIAWHMFYHYFEQKQLLWERGILAIELLFIFITGLIPSSYPAIIANTLVSFAASLQFCAFRKFGADETYASIFCTGNMRSCAEYYYKGIAQRNKQYLKKALRYSCILISFFAGAIVGALTSMVFHEKSIWIAGIVILTSLVLSFARNNDIGKKRGKESIFGHM